MNNCTSTPGFDSANCCDQAIRDWYPSPIASDCLPAQVYNILTEADRTNHLDDIIQGFGFQLLLQLLLHLWGRRRAPSRRLFHQVGKASHPWRKATFSGSCEGCYSDRLYGLRRKLLPYLLLLLLWLWQFCCSSCYDTFCCDCYADYAYDYNHF